MIYKLVYPWGPQFRSPQWHESPWASVDSGLSSHSQHHSTVRMTSAWTNNTFQKMLVYYTNLECSGWLWIRKRITQTTATEKSTIQKFNPVIHSTAHFTYFFYPVQFMQLFLNKLMIRIGCVNKEDAENAQSGGFKICWSTAAYSWSKWGTIWSRQQKFPQALFLWLGSAEITHPKHLCWSGSAAVVLQT